MSVPDWWKPYAADFPGWQVWKGVDSLYYGSLEGADPPLITRGEDAEDLKDMITRAQSDHKCWWEHR
jgi:hypothetical protein